MRSSRLLIPDHPARQAPSGRVGRLRVLVADDHALFREGLRVLLPQWVDVEIVGEAADGEQALEIARRLRPDVVLLDDDMPKLSGLDILSSLRESAPEVRIIVLTGLRDVQRAMVLLEAGVDGYLPKVVSYRALGDALRAVARGDRVFQLPGAGEDEVPRPDAHHLTPRELDVLRLVAEGRRSNAIAVQLGISERTVRYHLTSLFTKLDVGSRTELVYAARQLGWVR
jgi:DNA-binding NarL/FixJ family response regulator